MYQFGQIGGNLDKFAENSGKNRAKIWARPFFYSDDQKIVGEGPGGGGVARVIPPPPPPTLTGGDSGMDSWFWQNGTKNQCVSLHPPPPPPPQKNEMVPIRLCIDCNQFQNLLALVPRIGQLLNIHYEKLDMKVMEAAIESAVARWGVGDRVEFTVAESSLIPEDSKGKL